MKKTKIKKNFVKRLNSMKIYIELKCYHKLLISYK